VDPSLNVVNVLKQTIKDSDIPEHALIKIHHKKGQEITLNPMSKLIFLAGMGGEEIQEILQHIGPQLGLCDTVVISPHRKILELRAWLSASHYRLLDERVIYENGQFYQVIALKQNSDLPQVSSYGISLWQNEVGRTYRLHMIRSFSCHVDLKSRQFVEYLKCLSC
jgi:tRNA A22 N-methylase